MTAAETGLLLLCCALPEAEDRPLTMAQFQELAKRARALGPGGENPLRELTARDLERLGYSQEQCGRIVRLLSRDLLARIANSSSGLCPCAARSINILWLSTSR